MQQAAGDGEFLLHAARKFAGQRVAFVRQFKFVEQFAADFFPIGDLINPRDKIQVLPDGEIIEQARFVGEKASCFLASIGSRTMSWPATRTVPRDGGMMPARQRSVVVLPAPFGPTRPSTSPGWREKDNSLTAVIRRKVW